MASEAAVREVFQATGQVLLVLRCIVKDDPPPSSTKGRVVTDYDLAEDLSDALKRYEKATEAAADTLDPDVFTRLKSLCDEFARMARIDPEPSEWIELHKRATLLTDALSWLDSWDEEDFLLVQYWAKGG